MAHPNFVAGQGTTEKSGDCAEIANETLDQHEKSPNELSGIVKGKVISGQVLIDGYRRNPKFRRGQSTLAIPQEMVYTAPFDSNDVLPQNAMRKLVALFAVLLLLTIGSPDPSAVDSSANVPPIDGQTPQPEFVFNLYRAIVQSDPERNVTVSPYGVGRILDLARHGAAGETRTEIEQVLGYTEWVQWETRSDDTLTIADALWIQQGYPILPEFLQMAREHFGSSIEQADFARNPNEAVRRINAWCSANTKGKIPSLFNRLSPDTRLVLANAIHFFADWKIQFNRNRTREGDFTLLDGGKARTRLMSQEIFTRYGETDDTFALELLYEDENYAMVILLPKSPPWNPVNFVQWESEMTTEKFNLIRRSMRMDYVNIRMPRFTMESDIPLNATLQQLGMRAAFRGDADFSNITTNHADLFVTDVRQKTFVEVDETGTRAAVTSIGIGCSSGPPPQPRVFHADRPFLYAIVKGDTILFLGRFVKP